MIFLVLLLYLIQRDNFKNFRFDFLSNSDFKLNCVKITFK